MKFIIVFNLVIIALVNCESLNFDFFTQSLRYNDLDSLSIDAVENSPEEKWFTQYLDHYNSSELRSWQQCIHHQFNLRKKKKKFDSQRYFMNTKHYKNDGPVFLIVNGEWKIQSRFVEEGFVFELAKKFGAMCFSLEHRYYGMSRPIFQLTTSDDLIYLNSEQALMDTAYFISKMNSVNKITKKSKWILFGSSYAGSLVTWLRMKYPHLVHAAVSQSAPLIAKVDYPEFYGVIHNTLKNHSKICYDAVAISLKEFYVTLRDEQERKQLEKLFKFCNHLDDKEIIKKLSFFYEWFLEILLYITTNQYITMNEACELLMDKNAGTPLDRLAAINDIILERKGVGQTCFPPKNIVGHDDKWAIVSWIYQTCTEFGWYQTTFIKPFNLYSQTIPVTSFLERCIKGFGPRSLQTLELGVERTNRIYGGLDIVNFLTNVVFVHGSNDPWRSAGIYNSTNPKAPVIIVNGGGHSPLILPSIENDTDQVDKAKQRVEKLITSWLNKK